MASKKRRLLNPKTVAELAVFSLLYGCYWWVRHGRRPSFDEWMPAFIVWVCLYLVQSAYRRIIGELERLTALLTQIAIFLEEQGRR